MTVYATPEFKGQVEGLAAKNAYSQIVADLCHFLKDKDMA